MAWEYRQILPGEDPIRLACPYLAAARLRWCQPGIPRKGCVLLSTDMGSCSFCSQPSVSSYALTALRGDADDRASWRRVMAASCKTCHTALTQTGESGRLLKATGERWSLGHRLGNRCPMCFRPPNMKPTAFRASRLR
jgi:hypothetical protein